MSQAKTNKLYRTFVRGLITEASPLTYPEDSSFDELNTVPSRKGNRTRRLGMDYNDDSVAHTYNNRDAKNEFVWEAVAQEPELTFLVVQEGSLLTFYDRAVADFSDAKKSFSVNLGAYARPGLTENVRGFAQMASGKGYLFVVNADIEPLVVTYDKTLDDIGVTKIAILARDFEGLNDGLSNDEEPTTLSKEHFYNLRNQGWVAPNP